MDDCIFCKIAKKEIPTELVKEIDNFIVIKDIKPQAKTHLLIISKNHVEDISKINDDLLVAAKNLAMDLQKELNLDEFQFRVNWGKLLEVNHLHFHFLANF